MSDVVDLVEKPVIPAVEPSEKVVEPAKVEEIKVEGKEAEDKTLVVKTPVVKTEEQKEQERVANESKEKHQSSINKRFKELTTDVKTARKDVDAWKAIVREVTGKAPPERVEFRTQEEFLAATEEYKDSVRIPKTMLAKAEKDVVTAETNHDKALMDTWEDRVTEYTKEKPDYSTVLAKANMPLSKPVMNAILKSGPAVAYYLATNIPETLEMLNLPIEEQLQEIGAIKSKVQTGRSAEPVQKKQPNDPPGASVKGDSAPSSKRVEDMSLDEYEKWRHAGGGR